MRAKWWGRCNCPAVAVERLIAIEAKLDQIINGEVKIMAKELDLQNDLDTIKAGIATVGTKLAAQSDQIATLQAQIAAGTPVSQDQLDALKAQADDIVAALQPLTA